MPQHVEVGLQILFAVLALVAFGIAGFTDWAPDPKRLKIMACGFVFMTLAFFVAIKF